MQAGLLVFALQALLAAAATNTTINSTAPTVTLKAGTLRGGICSENPSAAFFKSIPYAQPPVGDLRFASPQPLQPSSFSTNPRDATIPPPACVQFGAAFLEAGPQSEDCLYINVWKPANATPGSQLPVRVWLYGGNDLSGGISDPAYDGCAVAAHDAVMVAVNYRLGPLGFLALGGDSSVRGNQAIEDTLLALQWVQENIAAFGGDPTRVMLHGQSSGAANAFAIATLPHAPTLMRAVILQSGGGRHAPLPHTMVELGRAYAAGLNCSNNDLACLRRASVKDIQTTFDTLPLLNDKQRESLALNCIDTHVFGSYVDGKVIPTQPADAGVRVPAVFGSNSDEGTLFTQVEFHTKGIQSAQPSDYTQFLADNFGAQAAAIEQKYPVSNFDHTPAPAFYAIANAITLGNYLCPVHRGLQTARAKGVAAWTYRFAQQPTCPWFPSIPADHLAQLGAAHTAEIPFVFDTTEHLPRPNGSCAMTAAERGAAAAVSAAWTDMAKNGRPVLSDRDWPAYTGGDHPPGLRIDGGAAPGPIDMRACAFWDAVNDRQVQAALRQEGAPATTATTPPTGGSSPRSGGSALLALAVGGLISAVL